MVTLTTNRSWLESARKFAQEAVGSDELPEEKYESSPDISIDLLKIFFIVL